MVEKWMDRGIWDGKKRRRVSVSMWKGKMIYKELYRSYVIEEITQFILFDSYY